MKSFTNHPMSLASIAAERAKLEGQLAALSQQEAAVEQHTKIITMTDEFLVSVEKIAGKPMTIADLAAMRKTKTIRSYAVRAATSDKTKRLTEDEIAALAKRLTIRAALRAADKPCEQITLIAKAFGISPQTVQSHEKKRIAEEATKDAARKEFEKGQSSPAPAATESSTPAAPTPEVAATV